MVLGAALAIIGIIVVIIGLLSILGLSTIIPGDAVAGGLQGAFSVFLNWWQLWLPILIIAVVAYIARGSKGSGSSTVDTAIGAAEGVTKGLRSDGGEPEPGPTTEPSPDPGPDPSTPSSPDPSGPSDTPKGPKGEGYSGGDNNIDISQANMMEQQQQMLNILGGLIEEMGGNQQMMAMQFAQMFDPDNVSSGNRGINIDLNNGSAATVDAKVYSKIISEINNLSQNLNKNQMQQILQFLGGTVNKGGLNENTLEEILTAIKNIESGEIPDLDPKDNDGGNYRPIGDRRTARGNAGSSSSSGPVPIGDKRTARGSPQNDDNNLSEEPENNTMADDFSRQLLQDLKEQIKHLEGEEQQEIEAVKEQKDAENKLQEALQGLNEERGVLEAIMYFSQIDINGQPQGQVHARVEKFIGDSNKIGSVNQLLTEVERVEEFIKEIEVAENEIQDAEGKLKNAVADEEVVDRDMEEVSNLINQLMNGASKFQQWGQGER